MRVVFLDIDGVLNNIASAAEGVDIIPEKVILVRQLCKATDAHIVISSTWRIIHSLEFLREMLYRTGLKCGSKYGQVIDVTPDSTKGHRGTEIQQWLDEHPEVTDFVILDDDSDMLDHQLPFFIKTNFECGLTTDNASRAIAVLLSTQHP